MNDDGNRYGFSSNIDTHMMKNSEWAVVAYISQSKYGKLGNTNFTGANKEIYQNKSDNLITGCSYGNHSISDLDTDYGCQYTYDVEVSGTGASTTGTIYGIYDMSGGSWEYVMANYNDVISQSGFVSMPESKYYDKYITTDVTTACNGNTCVSHGLGETSGWYNDTSNMVRESNPWFVRGGGYEFAANAGIFIYRYSISYGANGSLNSFRIVLTL